MLEGWCRFVVSSFAIRQLLEKSNKNGTNIAYKWDQSGTGGEGVLDSQRKYEKVKQNVKVNKQNKKKRFLLQCGGDFLKIRRAQRLRVYRCIINNCDTNCIQNIAQRRTKNKQKMSQSL